MTKSTDSKNIKKIIQSLLHKYQVDNLQLEIDLFSVWMRYMNEREEGYTPAETRERITAEFGVLGFIGVSESVVEHARMTQLIMDTLGLDVNEDTPEWQTVISFCLEAEKRGEGIRTFRLWMNDDPYNSPKKHQIAQDPLLIKKTWRSAFESVRMEKKTDEQQLEYDAKGYLKSW